MENLRKAIRKIITESLSENDGNNGKVVIKNASKEDFNDLIGLCDDSLHFQGFSKACSMDPHQRIKGLFDPSLTFKATYDGKLAGFYFLSDKESVFDWAKKYLRVDLASLAEKAKTGEVESSNYMSVDFDAIDEIMGKRGVQGVALGVNKELRGLGIGKELLSIPKTLGYDYIWGIQTIGMSDMEAWLKRRKPLLKYSYWVVTYQVF